MPLIVMRVCVCDKVTKEVDIVPGSAGKRKLFWGMEQSSVDRELAWHSRRDKMQIE